MNIILLSGGRNQRIGREKAFIEIRGKSILEIVLEKLNRVKAEKDKIILVANRLSFYQEKIRNNPSFSKIISKITGDLIFNAGPLGGIYSGLAVSDSMYNFVFACDMPFLNVRLIQYMLNKEVDYDILVPKYDKYFEPLHAIYSKRILPLIKRNLENGIYQIQSIFSEARTKYVTKSEMERFGRWKDFFFNINTIDDLREAQIKRE